MPDTVTSPALISRRRLLHTSGGFVAVAAGLAFNTLRFSAARAAGTSPADGAAPAGGGVSGEALLPREVVVPLSAVDQVFPDITQEDTTGPNPSAVGDAAATRLVIYASADDAKRVTISVDQYPGLDAASSAFQQAVQASEAVPGFDFLPAPNLGGQAFLGTVTQGIETHVGLGVLSGGLIVGATIAGYDATADNITNLLALAVVEIDAAAAALGSGTSK